MKRSVIIALVCGILLTSCSSVEDSSSNNKTPAEPVTQVNEIEPVVDENVELPEDELIVLIGNSGGYPENDHFGVFVWSDGGIYTYMYGQEAFDQTGYMSFHDRLKAIKNNSEPFARFDLSDLEKIYGYSLKVDKNAKMNSVQDACDAGITSVEFYDSTEQRFIRCSESGDRSGMLDDKYAEKIDELFMKTYSELDIPKDWTKIAAGGDEDFAMENFGLDHTDIEGRYILSNDIQLKAIADKSSQDILTIGEKVDPNSVGEVVYLVDIGNTPNVEKGECAIYDGEKVIIAGSGETFDTPAYCRIAVVPKEMLYNTYSEDPEEMFKTFIDENGSEWQSLAEGDLDNDPNIRKDFIDLEPGLGVEDIMEKYEIDNRFGILINDAIGYDDFVDFADENKLIYEGSVNDVFQGAKPIDFENETLVIKLLKAEHPEDVETRPTRITADSIFLPYRVSYVSDKGSYKYLVYMIIPNEYLPNFEYSVL